MIITLFPERVRRSNAGGRGGCPGAERCEARVCREEMEGNSFLRVCWEEYKT